jgi:hypothetical protein
MIYKTRRALASYFIRSPIYYQTNIRYYAELQEATPVLHYSYL